MKVTSGTKDRRKTLKRVPLEKGVQLNQRGKDIPGSIIDFGGVLTTLQIAQLFYPPSLSDMFRSRLGWTQTQVLLDNYPAAKLYEAVQQLKFLQAINRVQLTSKATLSQRKLGTWLAEMEKYHPVVFEALNQAVQNLRKTSPQEWLLSAISQDITPLEAFLTRPASLRRRIPSTCTRQMRLLYDLGYVERVEQPTLLSEGRKPLLNFLTDKGRKFVAEERKTPLKHIPWKPARDYNIAFLDHLIRTNDLRITFTLAAEMLGFQIKRWISDDELRRIHSRQTEKVTLPIDPLDPNSRQEAYSVTFDGFLWLSTGDKQWHQFIETDLGSRTIQSDNVNYRDWELRIRVLSEYYKSGRYHLRYPEAGKSMRLLTVTTSETRLRNIKEITELVIQRDSRSQQEANNAMKRYWFTTFDKIAPSFDDPFNESILTGKIWLRASQEQLRALIW